MEVILSLKKLKLVKFISLVLKRAILLYIILFSLQRFIVDYDRLYFGLRVRIIDSLMPSDFNPLIQLIKNQDKFIVNIRQNEGKGIVLSKELAEHYISYVNFYRSVADLFPERADAWNALGFLYYVQGDVKKSLSIYNKAIQINPDIFWVHYNKGLLNYIKGNQKETIVNLEKALRVDLKKTLEHISHSKIIYLSIILSDINFGHKTRERLFKGYSDAYRLLIINHLYSKDYVAMLKVVTESIYKKAQPLDDFYFYGGLAHFHLKQYDQAILFFKECLKINKNHREAYEQGARVYQSIGDEKNSEKLFAKALSLKNSTERIGERENKMRLQIF